MKRLCVILTALIMAGFLCSCAGTGADGTPDMLVRFVYGDKNISVVAKTYEAKMVAQILDSKRYNSTISGMPSCGFSPDISIWLGEHVYAIACDGCNYLQDMNNMRCYQISAEDMETIHEMFVLYGGYFPCV